MYLTHKHQQNAALSPDGDLRELRGLFPWRKLNEEP